MVDIEQRTANVRLGIDTLIANNFHKVIIMMKLCNKSSAKLKCKQVYRGSGPVFC